MERIADKSVIFLACLAGPLALRLAAGVAGAPLALPSAPEICLILLAVCASAVAEALPGALRIAAPLAFCVIAPGAATGPAMLPLITYDIVREMHRTEVARIALAAPVASLAASIGAGTASAPAALISGITMGLAALLSHRTSRMFARRETLLRTRDDLAFSARRLFDRAQELEAELKRNRRAPESASSGEEGSRDSTRACPPAFACLTEREFEVARLVAEGLENRDIAQAAYMSEGTVRNHISSALAKMHLKNRTQLAIEYWRAIGGV